MIKSGEEFLTTDGETPDYKGAVELVGKNLGLPFAKKGIDSINTDKSPSDSSAESKAVDDKRLGSDNAYRSAWVKYRKQNPTLLGTQVTHKNVMDTMKLSSKIET